MSEIAYFVGKQRAEIASKKLARKLANSQWTRVQSRQRRGEMLGYVIVVYPQKEAVTENMVDQYNL